MGFNIAGIVVNKNYENEITELGQKLGFNFSFEKEIIYEEALGSWKDEDVCDIYFTSNGTILFATMEMCANEFYIDNQNVFSFCYSESSMAFGFNYTENAQFQRSIVEYGGDIMDETGEPLTEEATSCTSEFIFDKISQVLGKDFLNIDLESRAFRYSI